MSSWYPLVDFLLAWENVIVLKVTVFLLLYVSLQCCPGRTRASRKPHAEDAMMSSQTQRVLPEDLVSSHVNTP